MSYGMDQLWDNYVSEEETELSTYIFRYQTNYGLGLTVVVAEDLDSAKAMAKTAGAWDVDDVIVIDSNTKKGIVISNQDNNFQ